jgi:hypothetical protein
LLEGRLDIESKPGQGTTILAWIPVNAHDPAETTNRENDESTDTNGNRVAAISAKANS